MNPAEAHQSETAGIPDEQRLDLWLWAARFFKSRALATTAVAGGKVQVNGQRCKPSRRIRPGDRLNLLRGREPWEINVLALCPRRGPASEAQACYVETATSRAQRLAEQARRRERVDAPISPQRPDKRQRRQLRQFNPSEEES